MNGRLATHLRTARGLASAQRSFVIVGVPKSLAVPGDFGTRLEPTGLIELHTSHRLPD
jgi:hypothetical protein